MADIFLNQRVGGSTGALFDQALLGATIVNTFALGGNITGVEYASSAGFHSLIAVRDLVLDSSSKPIGGTALYGTIYNASFAPVLDFNFYDGVAVTQLQPTIEAASAGDFAPFNAFIASFREIFSAQNATGGVEFNAAGVANVMMGSAYDDIFTGGVGDDQFQGGDGVDSFAGGAGFDLINYGAETGTEGVTISMIRGEARDTFGNVDTFTGVEAFRGTIYNDNFIGDAGNSVFITNGGSDLVDMGQGLDAVGFERPRSDFTISFNAGAVSNSFTISVSDGTHSTSIAGAEFILFSDGGLELIEHTNFVQTNAGLFTEDLLLVNQTNYQLGYMDLSMSGGVEVLGSMTTRHVAGVGNFSGDFTDDILYRSDSGWYGFLDSHGANTNLGFRNGESLVALGDFTGDGKDDILFKSDASGWLSFIRGGDQVNTDMGYRANQTLIAVADFNRDGIDDLLFRSDSSGWLSYARGGDMANVNVGFRPGQTLLAAADFNGDGKDDLLFRSDTSGWMSYASGANGSNVNFGYRNGQEFLGVGDFDGDGKADILFRQPSGWLSYMQGENGSNVNLGFAPGGYHLAAIADVYGNGSDDLVFQDDMGQMLKIMPGFGGPIETVSLPAAMDIVSADFGTNMGDDMLIA